MEKDLVKMDLSTLLENYMMEAKDFSEALSNGASWDMLREKRMYIRMLSEHINIRYKEQYNSERRRDLPPHGD